MCYWDGCIEDIRGSILNVKGFSIPRRERRVLERKRTFHGVPERRYGGGDLDQRECKPVHLFTLLHKHEGVVVEVAVKLDVRLAMSSTKPLRRRNARRALSAGTSNTSSVARV